MTLVGPARTGSTFAIMSFLCSLPFVGVIACSNTTLDDVAFIHLQLAVAGLTPLGVINANAALAQVDTEGLSPSHVLQKVFAALGQDVDDRLEADLLGHVSTKMQDYETLVGSLFLVVPPKERQMAVWFSWQSNGDDDGLKSALSTLFSSFEKLGLVRTRGKRAFAQYTAPMLEYLICRQISGQLLRGKGKLSVPTDAIDQMYRSDDPQPAASIFCATLETVWRDQARGIVALSDLTVAWHESWLGHRSGGL